MWRAGAQGTWWSSLSARRTEGLTEQIPDHPSQSHDTSAFADGFISNDARRFSGCGRGVEHHFYSSLCKSCRPTRLLKPAPVGRRSSAFAVDIRGPAWLNSLGSYVPTTDMSEVIKWQRSTVDVQARLIPRFLWRTASIDVFLDGQCIVRTGGQMKFTGSHSTTFTHSGSTHTAELSWGCGFLRWFPYKLQIDGASISEARVHVQNWPVGLIVAVLVAAVLLAIFHFVHVSRA